MTNEISGEQLDEIIGLVGSKRARVVVEHIAKHGQITTEELKDEYGYDHPPRAAKDVRDCGIPLETHTVTSKKTGRRIAAYRFGDLSAVDATRVGGRVAFSAKFKKDLVEKDGARCSICGIALPERYLQIDHRVPYEVGGDKVTSRQSLDDFALLCRSCNRAKSWSCEHCQNRLMQRSVERCMTCYWAGPDSYDHIALDVVRRLDIIWSDAEIDAYQELVRRAGESGQPLAELVKDLLQSYLPD